MNAAKSPSAWKRASDEIRQGLSFVEITKLLKRPYQVVAAAPIHGKGDAAEVVGVLAIDAPRRLHAELRDNDDVEHAIIVGTLALHEDMVDLYEVIHS
jgi:hypothetical protein